MMVGMSGGKHRARRLSRRMVVLLVVLGLLVLGIAGTAFGALRYDHNREGLILPGVRVDGIDVGNMDRARAVAAVAAVVDRSLEQEMTLDGHRRRAAVDRPGIGVEVPEIDVVGGEELVLVVPHDLRRDLRIVRVEDREGLTRDVVLQREPVGGELDLRRVLLRRLLVGLRPFDLLGGGDAHRPAVTDAPFETRRDELLRLVHVRGGDDVAGFDIGEDLAR